MKETACGIFVKGNKILFGKRFDDEDVYAGFWDIPSGHLEKGETVEQALEREMMEEVGVKIEEIEHAFDIQEIDPTSKNLYLHHCFFIQKWDGDIRNMGEFERIDWFTFDELRKMKSTLSMEYIKKCFDYYRG